MFSGQDQYVGGEGRTWGHHFSILRSSISVLFTGTQNSFVLINLEIERRKLIKTKSCVSWVNLKIYSRFDS